MKYPFIQKILIVVRGQVSLKSAIMEIRMNFFMQSVLMRD